MTAYIAQEPDTEIIAGHAPRIPAGISPLMNNANLAVNNPLAPKKKVIAEQASQTSLLQQEAFPGELAELRAQLNNLQAATQKTSTKKTLTADDSLLADQLIDVMPTGLVMLDGNGVVVKINQVARNLLDEPILGQPWFNVIKRSFNPQKDDWHEVSLKDGRRVKLEITSLGSQPGQLIMITDLTETRLLQDKLSQMQRLSSLGKMVSTLAHQIRTPLSAAILYGENLATNQLTQASRSKFQMKLNARLHDLEQQVNDMLLFSKSGNEQVVKSVNINELINNTLSSMEVLLDKANVQVKVQLSQESLDTLGNPSALTGALQNLIHNALQIFEANKTADPLITIQTYSQGNDLYLSLKDNGPGIDLKIQKKIFQPFFTSSSKGTGLGLAVVKSVINAHQGQVSLLNQSHSAENEELTNETSSGAHFVIKLPLLTQSDVAINKTVGEG